MTPRSPASESWTRAGLVIIAAIALTVIVLRVSIGIAASLANPSLSLKWHHGDARALRRLAEDRLRKDATPAGLAAAEADARRSLDRQPLEAGAVRTLGLAAGLRSDGARAARLLTLAERMSRRDTQTQVWLIEQAVAANDIPGALRHFDLALRTSADIRPTLFPILCNALSDPAIVDPAERLIEASTSWVREFVNFCVDVPEARAALAWLLTNAPAARAETSQVALAKLISALAAERDFASADRLYREATRHRALGSTAQSGITLTGGPYQPFDWTFAGGLDLMAQPSGEGLYLAAGSGRQGELSRRAIVLKPGTYRLAASFSPAGAAGGFVWSVTCDGPAMLAPTMIRASGGTFVISPGCPMQWLRLIALRAPAPGQTREGALTALRIVPASA